MIKGKTVKHCKKGRKGRTIKRHKTRKAAMKHHRAIMASKARRRSKKRGGRR